MEKETSKETNNEVYKALQNIQTNLKAPKGQMNNFGKYKYRSLEDILTAVKPLLNENNCTLTTRDYICEVGGRVYVQAIAQLTSTLDGSHIENVAYARESETKKGMDDSQVTGTASSYARKYCLNGLFAIDDTKDADTDEFKKSSMTKKEIEEHEANEKLTKEANASLIDKPKQIVVDKKVKELEIDADKMLASFNISDYSQMTMAQFNEFLGICAKKEKLNESKKN